MTNEIEKTQQNRDEMLLADVVREACQRCSTTGARTVYTIKKLQRTEQSRIAKAKEDAARSSEPEGPHFKRPDGVALTGRKPGDLTLLARHQAEHFFLHMPFPYQYALVDRLACDFDPNHIRHSEAPVRLILDVQDLSDEAFEEQCYGTRNER